VSRPITYPTAGAALYALLGAAPPPWVSPTTVGLDTLATLTRKGNAPRTLRESFTAMAVGSLYRVRGAGAAAAGVDRVLWGETDGGALGLPADTLGAPPYAEGYSDGEMWRWTVRP
jgi:hypothetical protein